MRQWLVVKIALKDKRNVDLLDVWSCLERKQENKHTKPVKPPNFQQQICNCRSSSAN